MHYTIVLKLHQYRSLGTYSTETTIMLTNDKQNVGKCINLQWIFVSYKIDINAIHIETVFN